MTTKKPRSKPAKNGGSGFDASTIIVWVCSKCGKVCKSQDSEVRWERSDEDGIGIPETTTPVCTYCNSTLVKRKEFVPLADVLELRERLIGEFRKRSSSLTGVIEAEFNKLTGGKDV